MEARFTDQTAITAHGEKQLGKSELATLSCLSESLKAATPPLSLSPRTDPGCRLLAYSLQPFPTM